VAVGEIGMDRHEYTQTKYENYAVDEDFIELQRGLLEGQIDLAIKYGKSVIFHNREAKKDVLHIVQKKWSDTLRGHAVFHCCEPDPELLEFAKKHEMYLGVDGDVTYFKEKAEFIKTVPLDMLVLETDAPFLLPEPYRTQKLFPNEPKHIKYIAEYIAKLKGITVEELVFHTTKNAFKLFNVSTTA
jgi:TatD DNase family protein